MFYKWLKLHCNINFLQLFTDILPQHFHTEHYLFFIMRYYNNTLGKHGGWSTKSLDNVNNHWNTQRSNKGAIVFELCTPQTPSKRLNNIVSIVYKDEHKFESPNFYQGDHDSKLVHYITQNYHETGMLHEDNVSVCQYDLSPHQLIN